MNFKIKYSIFINEYSITAFYYLMQNTCYSCCLVLTVSGSVYNYTIRRNRIIYFMLNPTPANTHKHQPIQPLHKTKANLKVNQYTVKPNQKDPTNDKAETKDHMQH